MYDNNNYDNGSGLFTLALGIAGLVGGMLLGTYLENTPGGQQMNRTLNDSCHRASNTCKRLSSGRNSKHR